MKGIVIASHGEMANGILDTSKLFFGEQEQLVALCLKPTDSPDEFVDRIKEGIKQVDTGDGVFVFCDMLFGSPCNCCGRILGENLETDKIDVICGVNLAMILQILATREAQDVTVKEILDAGHDGIADLKEKLRGN